MLFSVIWVNFPSNCRNPLHSCHRRITLCASAWNGWQESCHLRVSPATRISPGAKKDFAKAKNKYAKAKSFFAKANLEKQFPEGKVEEVFLKVDEEKAR